jgi:oligopeptide transport system substrate-binding protein
MARLALALAVVTLAIFPGTGGLRPARADDPITARLAMPPVGTLDPARIIPADQGAHDLAENLFAGLVRHDPFTNTIVPALARSWRVSADRLTWTFELRDDIHWVRYNPSTGEVETVRRMVSGDFYATLRRACLPDPPNPAARSVYIIDGCRTVARANPLLVDEAFIEARLGVRAPDPQTLEIRVTFEAPYLPALLALPAFRPVPAEAIQPGMATGDWTQPGVMLSSGPWVLAVRSPESLTLIRNPFWPEPAAGNVAQVAVRFEPPDRLAADIIAGQIDFARLEIDAATTVALSAPGLVLALPGQTVIVLGFSAELPVVSVEAARRALALALSRDALVAALPQGMALPMWRLTPPGAISGPNEPLDNRGFVPEAAQASLVEAGFARCIFGETLEFMVEDTPMMVGLARAIIEQWSANLGCNTASFRLTRVPAAVVERAANGTYSTIRRTDPTRPHLWLYTFTPDYLDVNAWTGDGLHCRFGYLRPGVPCGAADTLVDLAALEADPVQRVALYNEAEAFWFGMGGTFPVAPLVVTRSLIARQPWLEGWTINGPLWLDGWTISR